MVAAARWAAVANRVTVTDVPSLDVTVWLDRSTAAGYGAMEKTLLRNLLLSPRKTSGSSKTGRTGMFMASRQARNSGSNFKVILEILI